MKRNKKLVNEQINLEKKRVLNNKKGNKLHFNENKEIHYTKKFPDNKSVFYYPLKKNFMSDEEEKKYNHYYGEEFIDRVSRIDHSGKKETYLQDDLISTIPSEISGTVCLNSISTNLGSLLDRTI